MRRIDAVEIALATTLFLAGCGPKEKPQNIAAEVPTGTAAPRYIPADQLPVQRDKPFFIKYRGINPPVEHIEYLRKVCGDLGISIQTSEIVMATPETSDCFGKLQAQKP